MTQPERTKSYGVWAWLCPHCQHLLSRHGLRADCPIDGPYDCADCEGCYVFQSDPVARLPLSRAAYEAWDGPKWPTQEER